MNQTQEQCNYESYRYSLCKCLVPSISISDGMQILSMLGISIQELFNGLYLRFINFGSYRCALGSLMFLFSEQKIG